MLYENVYTEVLASHNETTLEVHEQSLNQENDGWESYNWKSITSNPKMKHTFSHPLVENGTLNVKNFLFEYVGKVHVLGEHWMKST